MKPSGRQLLDFAERHFGFPRHEKARRREEGELVRSEPED
jgi:hypothetical protein